MREHFPKIRIDLDEMLSEHQAENIRKGVIHIGISRQIGQYEKEKDMCYIPLVRDPLVAAVPINHPLAKKKSVKPSDLDCLPFISFPKDPFSKFANQSLSYLQEHGGTPSVGYEAKEIQTALGLVAAGLGGTLVGKTVAQNNRTDVVFVPVRGAQLESEIFAITSADKPNRVVQEFIQILCARM
jgi:DNA-binding transcriptional LysR family regulator